MRMPSTDVATSLHPGTPLRSDGVPEDSCGEGCPPRVVSSTWAFASFDQWLSGVMASAPPWPSTIISPSTRFPPRMSHAASICLSIWLRRGIQVVTAVALRSVRLPSMTRSIVSVSRQASGCERPSRTYHLRNVGAVSRRRSASSIVAASRATRDSASPSWRGYPIDRRTQVHRRGRPTTGAGTGEVRAGARFCPTNEGGLEAACPSGGRQVGPANGSRTGAREGARCRHLDLDPSWRRRRGPPESATNRMCSCSASHPANGRGHRPEGEQREPPVRCTAKLAGACSLTPRDQLPRSHAVLPDGLLHVRTQRRHYPGSDSRRGC